MKAFFLALLEVVEIAAIVIATILVIRFFLFQPFLVSGGSMEPTFINGDYLVVDQLTYRFREPSRGEVVVFKNEEGTYFIKRVIALPGDTINVSDGTVKVTASGASEATVLSEPYLGDRVSTNGDTDLVLRDGEYFVMGDNRSYSYDSRSWGALDSEQIVGLVRVRLWPVTSARAFFAPQYAL